MSKSPEYLALRKAAIEASLHAQALERELLESDSPATFHLRQRFTDAAAQAATAWKAVCEHTDSAYTEPDPQRTLTKAQWALLARDLYTELLICTTKLSGAGVEVPDHARDVLNRFDALKEDGTLERDSREMNGGSLR